MKQKAFRFTALLLCLILIFTLGACKGKSEEESINPAAGNSAVGLEDTLPPDEAAPPASELEAQSPEVIDPQESGAQTPDTPDSNMDTQAGTAAPQQNSAQPKTVAEIVAYYNAAANKIKSEKPGYTKVHKTGLTPGTQPTLKAPIVGNIEIPSSLLSAVIKDKTTQIAKGASSNDTYPAAGFSWASKLTAQYVKSATCTKSGSSYQIKINLKNETNPQIGKGGYGSCMSVIDEAGAKNMVKPITIKSITMQYHGGYINATIDIATGHITYAELYAASKMENAEISLGTINADVDSREIFKNFKW